MHMLEPKSMQESQPKVLKLKSTDSNTKARITEEKSQRTGTQVLAKVAVGDVPVK